ncbi:MAG: MoaD/ThiS family protein [Chloroflexota bacterium]
MPKVKVEILPWLSQIVAPEQSGRMLVEVEVQGDRMLDLLDLLAERYPHFAGKLYDVQRRDTTDLVEIAINGAMLNFGDLAGARLKEGDTVMLLSAFVGG